jgi:hypothetical protein
MEKSFRLDLDVMSVSESKGKKSFSSQDGGEVGYDKVVREHVLCGHHRRWGVRPIVLGRHVLVAAP